MYIHILAIGRERNAAAIELYQSYIKRIQNMGRKLGWHSITTTELRAPKNNHKQQEATALRAHIANIKGQKWIVALDEHGIQMTSAQFARQLADWQIQNMTQIIFVLGGANGLEQSFIDDGDMIFALGRMTWPHLLIRIMLAEQLWRSVSILANHPYHRA